MISAILLAWAPTTAYAGVDGVEITTIDRKGNLGLNTLCADSTSTFIIDIRGKGDFSYDGFGGETQPIFKKTHPLNPSLKGQASLRKRRGFYFLPFSI